MSALVADWWSVRHRP